MFEKAAIIAFIIFGLHYIMYTPGMILSFVADWFAKKAVKRHPDGYPHWIEKPIYSCPICQVPYYGSAIYWLFLGHDWREWIVVILTAMGINSVIVFLKHG